MSDDKKNKSIKKRWLDKDGPKGPKPILFNAEELDIHANKVTFESYIFYSKKIDSGNIARLEYDPENFTVDVIMKDGKIWDLGVYIPWLLRPYFPKAQEVSIVRTKNKEPIETVVVPLIHKEKKETKK